MNETEFEVTVNGQRVFGTLDRETGEVDVGDVDGMNTRQINAFVAARRGEIEAAVRNEHRPHTGERYLYREM